MTNEEELVEEPIKEVRHLFQNAYEVGKAGNRQTIRYWNVEELKTKVKELKEAGLMDEDGNGID